MLKRAARPPRRLMITKNLILMVVAVVIVFLAVYAWYANTSTVTASGTTVSAAEPGSVQVAIPFKGSYPTDADTSDPSYSDESDGFKQTINFPDTGFIKGDMFKDVTSDGKTFIIPTFEANNDNSLGRTVVTEGEWTPALSSKEVLSDDIEENDEDFNYISLDFYVRSTSPTIKVKSSSYLKTTSENSNTPLAGSEGSVERYDDKYGTSSNRISGDAIAGAVRVSLIGASVTGQNRSASPRTDTLATVGGQNTWNATASTRFMWLPRPDLLLNTNNDKTAWSLSQNVAANSGNNANISYRHSFYGPANDNVQKGVQRGLWYDKDVADSLTGTNKTNMMEGASAPTYFHVSKNTPSGQSFPILGQDAVIASDGATTVAFGSKSYYVYKLNLNIWIEGEDKEARRAMTSGQFFLHLDFGS